MIKRFIEDDVIYSVLPQINDASASEKGGGRPKFWEMVFWWTRKPLISARSVIVASLLPSGVDPDRFLKLIRIKDAKKQPHNYNPDIGIWKEYFDGKSMLDPFAGFGSIPLEGARLGLNTTAVELLPTATVFLKAVLEYPAKFGNKLVDDVEKWGNWITEQLENDPEIKELYDDDVAVYIGTWEIKCPHCGRWTPLIGNHWLARVKDGKEYRRMAFMRPKKEGNEVKIEIVDVNKIARDKFGIQDISKYVKLSGNKITIEKDGEVLFSEEVSGSNISPRKSTAQCLLCGNSINFWDELNSKHYSDMKDLFEDMELITSIPAEEIGEIPNEKEISVPDWLGEVLSSHGITISPDATLTKKKKNKEWIITDFDGIYYLKLKRKMLEVYSTSSAEFYVKWALKKYHEGDERFARQSLLVKVKIKDGDLEFEPATAEDNEKLLRAKEKITQMLQERDPDVPSENIPPYGNKGGGGHFLPLNYGMNKWHQLFNPRQLLTLIKIVRLIRDVGKRVEKEKLNEGWEEEKAFEYAEAVATYLSLMLVKHTQYNALPTGWNSSFWGPIKIRDVLSFRGISMQWNWIEVNSINKSVPMAFPRIMYAYQLGGLKYLTSALYTPQQTLGSVQIRRDVKALQGDATALNLGEKYDVIVTDPPYADDVPYTELSDFYYVWLKRALSNVENRKLVPRFHKTVFFKPFGKTWREIKTQWQEFALKEVSTKAGRFMDTSNPYESAEQHFRELLTQAFISMNEHLKEDGLIATYYAHTSPEAWAALLNAGWKGAKMRVTNAMPIVTESKQRVTGRGKLVLDTSIVVVWRKGTEGVREIGEIKNDVILEVTKRTMHLLRYITEGEYHLKGRDMLIGAMGAALSVITQYENLQGPLGPIKTFDLLRDYVYPYTVRGMLSGLTQTFKIPDIRNPYAAYYLVVKAFFGSTSNGSKFSRFQPTSDDLRILGISLSLDARSLLTSNLVKELQGKSKGTYELLEPEKNEPLYLEEFLQAERNIDLGEPNIRNSVDALHLLEYYAIAYPSLQFKEHYEYLKNINPSYVEEAINIAKILVKVLKNYDPEKYMCKEVLSKLRGEIRWE